MSDVQSSVALSYGILDLLRCLRPEAWTVGWDPLHHNPQGRIRATSRAVQPLLYSAGRGSTGLLRRGRPSKASWGALIASA